MYLWNVIDYRVYTLYNTSSVLSKPVSSHSPPWWRWTKRHLLYSVCRYVDILVTSYQPSTKIKIISHPSDGIRLSTTTFFDGTVQYWKTSSSQDDEWWILTWILTCIPYNCSVISLHQFWWHILCYLPAANDAMLASFLCELVDDREVESVRYIYIRK